MINLLRKLVLKYIADLGLGLYNYIGILRFDPTGGTGLLEAGKVA